MVPPEAASHKPAVRRPLLVESAAQTCPPCPPRQTPTAPRLRTKGGGLSPAACSCPVDSRRLTHGLHQHDVVSGSLAENNGLVRCSGDSAKCSRGWRWPDKSVHVPGELGHTSLIAQQRACSDSEEMHGPRINVTSVRNRRALTPSASLRFLPVSY